MSEEIGAYYDTWHSRYLKYYGDTIQAHRPLNVDDLLQYILLSSGLEKSMHILDAGCGVCGPAIYFASALDITIDAITISSEQFKEATKNILAANLQDRIKVVHGDFHNIENYFEKGKYDRILFLESLGHSDRQQAVLSAAASMLSPSGGIYIKDYFLKPLSENPTVKKLQIIGLENMKKQYYYYPSDINDTIAFMETLGLNKVFVKTPDFILDNENVVNAFEESYGIDLFEGNDKPLILDPLELLFLKS
jgi:2-polyprenyl-3-methyl-5-hydroxy-6-metoxy-1,4-benzoquinol methylase